MLREEVRLACPWVRVSTVLVSEPNWDSSLESLPSKTESTEEEGVAPVIGEETLRPKPEATLETTPWMTGSQGLVEGEHKMSQDVFHWCVWVSGQGRVIW